MKGKIFIFSWLLVFLIGAGMFLLTMYSTEWLVDGRIAIGLFGIMLIIAAYYMINRNDQQ